MIKILPLKTGQRIEVVNITSRIQHIIKDSAVDNGLCCVYVPHTTAGITINEGADPDVMEDVLNKLNELVPQSAYYLHTEGNADAHIKSILVGSSVTVPVEHGALSLGTWQSIFFCEFDGPRSRKVLVKIVKG